MLLKSQPRLVGNNRAQQFRLVTLYSGNLQESRILWAEKKRHTSASLIGPYGLGHDGSVGGWGLGRRVTSESKASAHGQTGHASLVQTRKPQTH